MENNLDVIEESLCSNDDIVELLFSNDDDLEYIIPCLILHAMQKRVNTRRKGSILGRMKNINRNIEQGHQSLIRDYFTSSSIFNDVHFRRRYRIPMDIFKKIVNDVSYNVSFFRQRKDAVGKLGASPEQKIAAALNILGEGSVYDRNDEYLRISESLSSQSLHEFTIAVVEIYGSQYLRNPTTQDVNRILKSNANRGFPGLFGSLDCTHWKWDNCPVAWKGHFEGKAHVPTVVLEAIASSDRWIWHAFFGTAGSNNDLNVLSKSPFITNLINGNFPSVPYTVNNNTYNIPYLFVDGIYPKWVSFVSTYKFPTTERQILFSKQQESIRKEVECAFGILKKRFKIISYPSRFWYQSTMSNIIYCCIILHNMLVEYDEYEIEDLEVDLDNSSAITTQSNTEICNNIVDYIQLVSTVQDSTAAITLRNDVVDHYWDWFGGQSNTTL